MKAKICKCTQCKGTKKKSHINTKTFFKRMVNKKIRKAKEGDAIKFYWA